ncbi:MAG: glycosyltransferase family 4 protein [Chloroflexia bacterium]
MRRTGSDVQLVVGEGTDGQSVPRLAQELEIQDYVRFLGFAPDDDVRFWYNTCTMFAMPSLSWRQEGFGMVGMEAMACGTPTVVSSMVGAVDDVREYDAALIVPPSDHLALARAMGELLVDADRRRELGENGRRLIIERYTWERVGEQTLELYRSLLPKGARA